MMPKTALDSHFEVITLPSWPPKRLPRYTANCGRIPVRWTRRRLQMPSSESRPKFYWSTADGRQLEIAAGTAQITVSEGVSIKIGPGVEGEGRPTVDLDLVTRVLGRDDAGELGKRFVVIPL